MKRANPDVHGVAVASSCQLGTTPPGQNASNAPSAGFAAKSLLFEHFLCSIFFSPNKFVFHSHRLAEGGKYIQPDAANFNSWRRHIRLLGDPPDEVVHAWEDVKVRQVPLFLVLTLSPGNVQRRHQKEDVDLLLLGPLQPLLALLPAHPFCNPNQTGEAGEPRCETTRGEQSNTNNPLQFSFHLISDLPESESW